MAPYVWCVIGAALGFVASLLATEGTITMRIEAIGVGVFGAFMGGEFLASYVLPAAALKGVNPTAAAMAVGGAVVSLVLLMMMRRAVGPMKAGKSRRKE